MKSKVPQVLDREASKQVRDFISVEIKKAICISLNVCLMCSCLTLIDDFGWGTSDKSAGKRELKLKRFVESYRKRMCEYSDTYDDAIESAMKLHLNEHGVIWDDKTNPRSINTI